jgi:type I restriction enzyme R subunit
VDFERAVALKARTEAIARNVTDFLKKTDRFAKSIVFCVDQEHADEMRRALNNLNDDLVRKLYGQRSREEEQETFSFPGAEVFRDKLPTTTCIVVMSGFISR